MNKLIAWLDGKKTIISAIVTAVWPVLYQQGIITQKNFNTGVVIGGLAVAIFMRLAVAKASAPVAHLDVVPITSPVPIQKPEEK